LLGIHDGPGKLQVLFYFYISKIAFMFELIFCCFLRLRVVSVSVWVSGNFIVGVIGNSPAKLSCRPEQQADDRWRYRLDQTFPT